MDIAAFNREMMNLIGQLTGRREGMRCAFLLRVSAGSAWLFGAALILVPATFYSPLGWVMDSALKATVAQAHGATLVGLGVINWLGGGLDRKAQNAIAIGNVVVQGLSLLVAILTIIAGVGASAAPAVVIHLVLGTLFLFFLTRADRLAG